MSPSSNGRARARRIVDFAPDYRELLKEGEATDGVLPKGLDTALEYTHKSCNAKGKKGMVLYKDAGDKRVLFVFGQL